MSEEEDFKTKLLSIEQAYQMVSATESMGSVPLALDGTVDTTFSLPSGWNVGLQNKEPQDLTEASVHHGGVDYILSKEAILNIAHAVGLNPAYVAKTPGVLIQSHLNYWASHSPDVSIKMLTKDGDKGIAICKQSIIPFSNHLLLEEAVQSICDTYGVEQDAILVDFKSHHDLHSTSLRLIVDDESTFVLSGEEDFWSPGVQIQNSLTGRHTLSINGYLFGWTSGQAVVMQHGEGRYNRKQMGQDPSEAFEWVANTVKNVLGESEHNLSVITSLTQESVSDAVAPVLADIFRTYKVPLTVRSDVMDTMVESEDLTYYGVVNALARSANKEGLPSHFVSSILEIAGDVAVSAHARCNNCKRVLV